MKGKLRLIIVTFLWVLWFIPSEGYAQTTRQQSGTATQGKSTDSLLIKHVYLISREDTLGDINVNILIINSSLQLVTKDDVSFGPNVKTLDGANGFLMGNVALGEPPSFVILDENPRENFDIFLNTRAHIRFAIEKGIIAINELRPIAHSQQETTSFRGQSGSRGMEFNRKLGSNRRNAELTETQRYLRSGACVTTRFLTGKACPFYEACAYAALKKLLPVNQPVNLYQLRHNPCPACLVAGPQSGTIVAMEILVKEYQVTPVRI